MNLTFAEAYNEAMAHFKTNFDLLYDNRFGEIPIEYPNIASGIDFSTVDYFIRVSEKNFFNDQKSLGEKGGRLFTRKGIVTIQIFTPTNATGLSDIKYLGQLVNDIFEGNQTSTGKLIFENVSYREIGISERWFQANVTSYYEYHVTK